MKTSKLRRTKALIKKGPTGTPKGGPKTLRGEITSAASAKRRIYHIPHCIPISRINMLAPMAIQLQPLVPAEDEVDPRKRATFSLRCQVTAILKILWARLISRHLRSREVQYFPIQVSLRSTQKYLSRNLKMRKKMILKMKMNKATVAKLANI